MHLTNKEPIRSDALAASGLPDAIGAPVKVIQVTPEMVLAGKEEMSCRWIEFAHGPGSEELWGEVLSKVFLAMLAARPQ
jgi:hypothetical protein